MPFLPPNQQCQSTEGNTARNSSYNFLSYPPDNHHSSDDAYWRGGVCHEEDMVLVLTENADELIRHIMSSTCLLVHPFNWTSGAETTLLGRTVLMQLIMATMRSRCGHYIFQLWLVSSFFFFFFLT